MSASSYNFDLPKDAPKDAPKGRPVDESPGGHHSHAGAMEAVPFNVSAAGAAPLQAPRGRAGGHRGKASGRYVPKDHVEARDVVSGCHLVVRDPRLVMSDQDRPYGRPANDWSQSGMSIAESQHRSMCPGGNLCPAPAFHFGLQDGSR